MMLTCFFQCNKQSIGACPANWQSIIPISITYSQLSRSVDILISDLLMALPSPHGLAVTKHCIFEIDEYCTWNGHYGHNNPLSSSAALMPYRRWCDAVVLRWFSIGFCSLPTPRAFCYEPGTVLLLVRVFARSSSRLLLLSLSTLMFAALLDIYPSWHKGRRSNGLGAVPRVLGVPNQHTLYTSISGRSLRKAAQSRTTWVQ